jgi:hypothetical protein
MQTQKGTNKTFHFNLGNKLPKQHIKRKQYTTTTDALTDNDVYGYTGSIGPFLQKRNFVPQTLGKSAVCWYREMQYIQNDRWWCTRYINT